MKAKFARIFWIIIVILGIALYTGFIGGGPDMCLERRDRDGDIIRDSNGKVFLDCSPWLRYLLFS